MLILAVRSGGDGAAAGGEMERRESGAERLAVRRRRRRRRRGEPRFTCEEGYKVECPAVVWSLLYVSAEEEELQITRLCTVCVCVCVCVCEHGGWSTGSDTVSRSDSHLPLHVVLHVWITTQFSPLCCLSLCITHREDRSNILSPARSGTAAGPAL